MKLYDKVCEKGCYPYVGTIIEICSGKLDGMAIVAWPGGRACQSMSNLVLAND